MLELRRQAFHLVSFSLFAVLLLYLPLHISAAVLAILLAGLVFVSAAIVSGLEEKILPPSLRIAKYIKKVADRDKDKQFPFYGAILGMVGIGLSVVFLGSRAYIPILVLGWGDSASTVVGVYFGRHKLLAGRSLEGAIGFFLASLVPLFLATSLSPWVAVFTALVGTVTEILSPIDDNVTIPLAVSVVLRFLA